MIAFLSERCYTIIAMKIKKLFFTISFTICICLIAAVLFLFPLLRFAGYCPDPCPESADELDNPYIGWYQIRRYELSDTAAFDLAQVSELTSASGMILLEINLKNYAGGPISDKGLLLLEELLESFRSSGRQLIIRFLYDWAGDASSTEPKDISIILGHMSQTSEIMNQYSDCVYILQGIFIGSWGEMHGSRYANTEDMLTLIHHLSSVTDPEIFLAVRTPWQWRLLSGSPWPLDEAGASDSSLASRLGLFNDGMLGSDTDLNTYASASSTVSDSPYEKKSRQDEIAFQNLLCSYVPNGGEVVLPNPFNDFTSALKDLSDTHVSYLNQDYDKAVLDKWQAESFHGSGPFQGMNGLDYISRHLGYRYVLRSSECTAGLPWKNRAGFSVTLENVGFSGSYRPFELSLTLRETSTGRIFQIPFDDPRLPAPGETIELKASVPIRDYATGTYEVRLKISDPVSKAFVFLANEGAQDDQGFVMGELTLGIFPQ